MENNDTTKPIELSQEFWEWLWEKDRKSYAYIVMGHTELIEEKYKEYEQAQANKEREDRDGNH